MGNLGPAVHPFQIMSLDTIGGFAGRRSTKQYLYLLIDHFTRYVYTLTLRNQTASESIKLIEVNSENPIETLSTELWGSLISIEFKDYWEDKEIIHIIMAVDSVFRTGLKERTNQTFVNRIRCRHNRKENDKAWCTIVLRSVKEFNSAPHSSAGSAPNYLLNGIGDEIVSGELAKPSDLLQDRKVASERSPKVHKKNKKYHDKN